MEPVMSPSEVLGFLEEVFPQVGGRFDVLDIGPGTARVRLKINDGDLRPGGTVSGPTMFSAADVGFYVVTLAHIGPEALTVTTNCSIDFMRKPGVTDLIGEARILKLGRSLVVGDVLIFSEGQEAPVARASMTYSIPPRTGG